jgi:hypothetical protein
MVEKTVDNPFEELPESLVEEMLGKADELGENLSASFQKLYDEKSSIILKLRNEKLLKKDSDILGVPSHPTTCGIDGALAVEKLLATDMVAIAGVAVEGLTPPTEKRHWPKPRHYSDVLSIPHSDATTVVARAVMMCYEVELAVKAPHDVVLLDGSLTTFFIYLNQALNKVNEVSRKLSNLLDHQIKAALEAYKEILLSPRTDKIYVGLPKYTTRKEIVGNILGMEEYEDRGTLSFIIDAGEFVGPVQLQRPDQRWHIDKPPKGMEGIIQEIISALYELHVLYYRPYDHFPALRIEIAKSIEGNKQRQAVLFEALKIQCGAPGIMEPYPLYLADRMVKHLGTALPAIRKTTTQEMFLKWNESLNNMYLAMHGYRTEWGK